MSAESPDTGTRPDLPGLEMTASALACPIAFTDDAFMKPDPVALLQQLIRIPSVNPDNADPSEPTGEKELADFLANHLEDLGAVVELEEILPGRPNLIARFTPLDGRPRMLLGPHLDTVGTTGMTIDPFCGSIDGDKIQGRGASDTKGPMAAMIAALTENRDLLPRLPVAVDFVAFMAEESGQWGSRRFAETRREHYGFAMVGEPTSMQTVHVTKGSTWATLRATGKAAHSSTPEQGDNAILKLVRAISALEAHFAPLLSSHTHPLLGASTMNIGMIHGGTRPNVVPDLAEASIDIRSTPSLEDAGGALRLLKQTIASLQLGIEVVNAHENPPMETSPDLPAVAALLATPGTSPAGAPWFSDAAHLSAGGIPSVCIGPGSIRQAHTADEFILTADLLAGTEFFSRFLRRSAAGT
jgi:acetylornithine deacetylase/succinyl-diaminopimelate desuccinylase-like protein